MLQPRSCKALTTIKPGEISVLESYRKHQGRKSAEKAVKMLVIFHVLVPRLRPCQPMAKFSLSLSLFKGGKSEDWDISGLLL